MTPKEKWTHLVYNIKNRIAGLRHCNMTYKDISYLSEKKNVKTSLSAVKRIGLSFESEGSVTRKPGSSRPRTGFLNLFNTVA